MRGLAPLVAPGTKITQEEYDAWYDRRAWKPSRESGLVVQHDLSPAEWIEPRLHGGREVGSIVPDDYPAYAKIFFPFVGDDVVVDGPVRTGHVTWRERAEESGRTVHALMEAETICTKADGSQLPMHCYPDMGPDQLSFLMPILRRHTTAADGWFLLWEGWGALHNSAFGKDVPKVRLSGEDSFLLHGPIEAYRNFRFSPDYWWPEDRAWIVVGWIDFTWGYLAGSADLIDEVVSVPVIDAYETTADAPFGQGTDVINDPDGKVSRDP